MSLQTLSVEPDRCSTMLAVQPVLAISAGNISMNGCCGAHLGLCCSARCEEITERRLLILVIKGGNRLRRIWVELFGGS